MDIAILTSIAVAALAGLCTGFGRWWQETLISACIAFPLAASAVFAFTLETPSYFDKLGWLLMTFLYSFLCSFVAWGLASSHFALAWLHRKLTLVRADAQKAARRST